MANIPRSQAKVINLGLFYGMGKLKLQKELNLERIDANKLFQTYHGKVPFVKQFILCFIRLCIRRRAVIYFRRLDFVGLISGKLLIRNGTLR
jgi:DNA polymerase I-like protein with 3'-5' exonuclease and polymerase domains